MPDFIKTFLSLILIVDPLGSSAIFAALTANLSRADAYGVALRAAAIAAAALLCVGMGGSLLFSHAEPSLAIFRIAGGILLSFTAYKLLAGGNGNPRRPVLGHFGVSVFPLAIPLLAGPGCMTVSLIGFSGATDIHAQLMTALAIVAVEIVTLVSMIFAARLSYLRKFDAVLTKVAGLFLVAMSAHLVTGGIKLML